MSGEGYKKIGIINVFYDKKKDSYIFTSNQNDSLLNKLIRFLEKDVECEKAWKEHIKQKAKGS